MCNYKLDQLRNFQKGNESIEYLIKRIKDPNYRGIISSQHNRWKERDICTILEELNKVLTNDKLQIRTTDLSKDPKDSSGTEDYSLFCSKIKGLLGKGTQDSLRKNIFPDLHRMGFIERFDKKGHKNSPYESKKISKYVSLSELGKKYIESSDKDKSVIFSNALSIFLDKILSNLLSLDVNYDIRDISGYEIMFFVTAINCEDHFSRPLEFSITLEECAELIKSYRNLAKAKTNAIVNFLKEELSPDKEKNKKDKRDWGNWLNKTQQILHLANQTIYSDEAGNTLSLNNDYKFVLNKEIRKRSFDAKEKYFKNHSVNKKSGFELHHIIPLEYAKSDIEYKLLDTWENLIYINAYAHARIPKRNNNYISINFNDYNKLESFPKDAEIILRNIADDELFPIKKEEISYLVDLRKKLFDFNVKIIDEGY